MGLYMVHHLPKALHLTGHQDLELTDSPNASGNVLLLSAPSVAASPVGEFGFRGLRKPHKSEFDFRGPCGAHLVRQKSWKCDQYAGQGPVCFQ